MSDQTLDERLNHVLWDNLDLEPGSTDARPMKVKLAADLKYLIESEISAAEARGRLDAAREIGLAASGAGLKVEHLERYEDWHAAVEFLQFHAEALGREQVLSHTGFLRQWLNERPSGSLVVDAELRHWLEFGLKQAFPTKPDRQTLMGYKVEVDENLNGNEWHLKSSPTQGSSSQ